MVIKLFRFIWLMFLNHCDFCVDLLSSNKKDKVEVAVVTENYELWRERMLQKAYAELATLKQQELTRPLD